MTALRLLHCLTGGALPALQDMSIGLKGDVKLSPPVHVVKIKPPKPITGECGRAPLPVLSSAIPPLVLPPPFPALPISSVY